MGMLHSKFFFSAILLVMFVGPPTAIAAETQAGKPEAEAQAGEESPECQDKVGDMGHPHKIDAIARLAAVRAWSLEAKKYGEEYTMWHNAKSQSIRCDKLARSDYIMCFASGKPCRAAHTSKTASHQTN
jgi:hypothetical protein